MLLRQEVERRKLIIIRKLLGLGLAEINGQTLDQLTLTQLEGILTIIIEFILHLQPIEMMIKHFCLSQVL
ncbi:hypothetical protein COK69_05855 [Bacillus cereus]|uniref:hypothetical protein n=1 Tax=Bacillus paranthracis TaxID=2026186 RepID=UPI000BF3D8F1|nr:hypothetical protein COK69_05855 [Bacillus cereus]